MKDDPIYLSFMGIIIVFLLLFSCVLNVDRCCWKLSLPGDRPLLQCLQDCDGDRHYGYIQHQQGGL